MTDNRIHTIFAGADINPPLCFNNPFAYVPHPLCLLAAAAVREEVERHEEWDEELRRGKMFGVLIVRRREDEEKAGEKGEFRFLAAFSGQLNGKSEADGFVPPVFDVNRSETFMNEMREIEKMVDNRNERRRRSEALQDWLFCQYTLLNALGKRKTIMDIFTDYYRRKTLRQENYSRNASTHHIPSGTGECCAPKLLQYAYLNNLQPLCMAEFWIQSRSTAGINQGPQLLSPLHEVRHDGQFYPACHKKCRPLLEFMLQGVDVAKSQAERQEEVLMDQVGIVYEDEQVIIIDKPSGLLSVPGRGELKSVADWLGEKHGIQEFWFVHRLDQDTSGLLVIAKDETTYKNLQQQFIRHEVSKTYEALLDGNVKDDEGIIKLRMRPDPDDPPRQIVDPDHGKQAVSRWRVKERNGGQTLVELYPDTGRTHQLRVHCAHPQGLNAPIHGDRLYGKGITNGSKLCLRAKSITLTLNGERRTFSYP